MEGVGGMTLKGSRLRESKRVKEGRNPNFLYIIMNMAIGTGLSLLGLNLFQRWVLYIVCLSLKIDSWRCICK